jgi:hypothetical protein
MALLNNARPLAARVPKDVDTEMSPLETVLAALPPALFGLMLSAFLLGLVPLKEIVWGGPTRIRVVNPTVWPYVLPGLVGAVLVVGGLFGASQRLPRWSYTWATGGVVAVLFGLVILGDELPYLISPTVDALIVLSLVGLLAVLASVGAWRALDDAALVGLGFAGAFATTVTFFATAGPFSRLDIGLLCIPVGLAFTLLIVTHVRGTSAAKRISVAAAAVLAAALIWMYRTVIFTGMPSFSDRNFHWKLLSMAWIGLLAPPLLSWLLRRGRSALGR